MGSKLRPVEALLLSLLITIGLWSCTRSEPVRVGFIGGLTGRVADLGIAGRDGVILATEEWNGRGGIAGRRIELLIRDDEQDPDVARRADADLIDRGVTAILGHMTSSMSMVGAALSNERNVVMLSPTTSTNDLSAQDDYFFRLYPASAQTSRQMADIVWHKLGLRTVTVTYDTRNRAHTQSAYERFAEAYTALGGNVIAVVPFHSGPEVRFANVAKQIAATPSAGVFILANAMDTAMLCQHMGMIDYRPTIFTTEWSATEDVIQFGGRSVEGIYFLNTFDRTSSAARFTEFRRRFAERFGYEAGFASTHAYDAANVLYSAMEKAQGADALRKALSETGGFELLQGSFRFDGYGDAVRDHVLMTIRDGQFQRAQ